MPVSVVVGGQFGSEGKGKVALEIVRRNFGPTTVVRVGGPNSGHTAYDKAGRRWALRQMPAACVDRNVDVVFPPGSYLDVDVLLEEISALDYPTDRIIVSPWAQVVTDAHRRWEQEAGLVSSIGSTGSGTGAAVMAAIARDAPTFPLKTLHAEHHGLLAPFVRCGDTGELLADRLGSGQRIVVEGSQGFGLSLLDGGYWPKATSRSTTAAAALAEAGLAPRWVDDVTMVLRSYPIRVAGVSGPLPKETTWEEVARRADLALDIREYTTVTGKLRRVGEFDALLVRRALAANAPNNLVLNHLDYVGPAGGIGDPNSVVSQFIRRVEAAIGRRIDWYGFSALDIMAGREQATS
ncbi:adenylosuccinate synthetase [Aurantimonas sp. VKM B-3413]|uniref:adenylosuccinate synthetase n=1 Tax=Aurantimonas sp. VKM B-3413 TaxID=2779401 RepID=UPI001E51899A|nr:adenylosuccinate synthetase [Aurantimonas sp. VKM B-3413]MCB8839498.1 adenylosuccinate synthetase [Aurantimonas sp. VKM B-3413]